MTVIEDFDAITLKDKSLSVVVGAGVTGFDEELVLDGSSTQTLIVHDAAGQLVDSGIFDSDGDGKLDTEVDMVDADGTRYRMGQVQKQGQDYTLTMELFVVSVLRDQRGHIRIARNTLTHVEFARKLVNDAADAAGVDFGFITGPPGPQERAALAKANAKIDAAQSRSQLAIRSARARRDQNREPGIADDASLKVKNLPATAEQRHVMDVVMTEATRHNPPPKALLALVGAIIVECDFRNVQGSGPDAVSFGVIQAIPGLSAGVDGTFTRAQALDIQYSVRSALLPPGPTSKGGIIRLTTEHPDWTPGQIAATAINGGGDPDYASKVNGWQSEAQDIIDAYTGGGRVPFANDDVTSTELLRIPQLTRGTQQSPNEDSWTCMRRIAADYGYRCFAIGDDVYYISDEALMHSRPQATLSEDSPGVDSIDWEWTPRKQVNTTTITCRAEAWQVPPGAVVLLQDVALGSGRWLVSSFRRSRFSDAAEVEVIRKTSLLKPRIPLEQYPIRMRSPDGSNSVLESSTTGRAARVVNAMYAAAGRIADRAFPYTYGGSHNSSFAGPYDCSGLVSAVLHAGGLVDIPLDTVALGAFGLPGAGQYVTIWVNPAAGRDGHTFIEFPTAPAEHRFIEANAPGGTIAGWRSTHDTGGVYEARHPRGL